MRLKIAQGRVFDPAQGWQGEVRDLYIDGDHLVSHLPQVDAVLEARDQAVVPGGIDLRGQTATYGLNFLRLWGELPSPGTLGETYAALGYTHVHEPFLTLATAAYVHRELTALPLVDTSASLVINLRDLDLWIQDSGRMAEIAETLQFFQEQTRALNLRVVEPWVRHHQEVYVHRTLPLEETLEVLARLAEVLQTTLVLEASPEVLRATLPEPRAFHLAALGPALTENDLVEAALAHLEGGTTADWGLIRPRAYLGANGLPVQVDLGLWQALSLAPPAAQDQARRALSLALAYEGAQAAFSGAGAMQGPVADYPEFFAWLGDRQARQEFWGDEVSPRQYSFPEWLWATRTLPARLLGLADRGHLGPGARADVALFDLPPEGAENRWPEFAGRCRTLLKGGKVVMDDFSLIRAEVHKATCYRQTGAEPTALVAELCQYRSFRQENLWVPEHLEGATWARV